MAFSGAAMATPGYTLIKNNGTYEQSMLSQVYGGSWSKMANGLDYTGNGMTATRVADSGVATPTSLTTGVAGSDQTWTGGTSVTLKISGGEDDHFQFGYYDDSTNHAFHMIIDTAQTTGPVTVALPSAFRWAMREGTSGVYMSSQMSDNMQGSTTHDQLVTYKMSGNGMDGKYMMFWEDHYHAPGGTQYDDMVVTMTAAPVPAPATAGILGLGALVAGRRRRR
jgi:hypothetical protein